MEAKLFVIEALSSMHVGNGEINYGLIDNLIQRDPVTEMPIINSSSLKGALREYFKHLKKDKDNKWTVGGIFGSDPKDNVNRKQGTVRFFEAELLAIPVRCNDKPYKMVTSEETVKGLKAKLESFGMRINEEKINELFKDIERTTTHPEFKELCSDDELPVISRNNLESGQSTNLWYEQVLPKHSLLGFVVIGDESEAFKAFCEELGKANVQIGANATIGYGFCKISEVC
jgi:CRISPR-associated protein Cmr4